VALGCSSTDRVTIRPSRMARSAPRASASGIRATWSRNVEVVPRTRGAPADPGWRPGDTGRRPPPRGAPDLLDRHPRHFFGIPGTSQGHGRHVEGLREVSLADRHSAPAGRAADPRPPQESGGSAQLSVIQGKRCGVVKQEGRAPAPEEWTLEKARTTRPGTFRVKDFRYLPDFQNGIPSKVETRHKTDDRIASDRVPQGCWEWPPDRECRPWRRCCRRSAAVLRAELEALEQELRIGGRPDSWDEGDRAVEALRPRPQPGPGRSTRRVLRQVEDASPGTRGRVRPVPSLRGRIPLKRLRSLPFALLCRECQEAQGGPSAAERRAVVRRLCRGARDSKGISGVPRLSVPV